MDCNNQGRIQANATNTKESGSQNSAATIFGQLVVNR